MKTLQEIYEQYQYPGGWGDKGTAHNYIPTYAEEMDRRNGVTVLEIGVCRGHSIKMWNEYFAGSDVYGIDINLDNVEFDDLDNIYICDGTDPTAVNVTFGTIKFDYVVDDGSHLLEHQLKSLDIFLPRMNKDGKYFCEDINGDTSLLAITDHLDNGGYTYRVVDGRGPDRPEDEISVVVYL